jgi:hypothetical protein
MSKKIVLGGGGQVFIFLTNPLMGALSNLPGRVIYSVGICARLTSMRGILKLEGVKNQVFLKKYVCVQIISGR